MSFNTALTTDQYTQVRRARWQGDQLVSVCDCIVAFHALVASNLNATGTTAPVPYNTVTEGAIANLDEGMTVIISPSSDIRNPLATRLHVTWRVADGTYLYVSEFSDSISVGAHIFVLYHYDIIDNLSRPVGTNPVVQYKQFDDPFERLAPVINGAQTGYADWVDANGYYFISFNLSTSFAAEYGATISSYLATVRATGSGIATVTAGALNTSSFTLRCTPGEYWLKLTATDSNGVTWFRHVLIKAHHRTDYPPTLGFEGVEITREVAGGPSARVKAFRGVDSLINGTMVIVWVDEQYSDALLTNATTTPIVNNIDFIGWIEAEENMFMTDPQYSAYAECAFELQGVGARLMRLEGQLLAITNNASPTLWDQINKLTPGRAIIHFLQRHTTALNLCSLTFQNMDFDETFLFPTIVTLAGRALDNVTGSQGIADQITAQLEFAADGRMELTRREPFVATDLSHTATIVATWDGRDICGRLIWKFNHYDQYGRLDADGAVWDGTNPAVVPFQARAPGLAQGSGPDVGRLSNQILASTTNQIAAQAELSQRAGTQHEIDNNTGELSGEQASQYHWLQPSFGQVYIFSLDTTYNIRGRTLDSSTHWMLKRVTIRHENQNGYREVQTVYTPVVTGTPAAAIRIESTDTSVPALPPLPPMPAFPNLELPETTIPDTGLEPSQLPPTTTTAYTTNGQILIAKTSTKAYILRRFIDLTTPKVEDVTPTDLGDYQIQAVAFSPFYTSTAVPAYILAYDGTNSAVWYSPNVLAGRGSVVWTKGADVSEHYNVLRATSVDGKIAIYTPNLGATPCALGYGGDSGQNGLIVTATGANSWHVAVNYHNPTLNRYFIELAFANDGVRCCDIQWAITNMTGWSNADFGLTNNGSVDEDGVCGTRIGCPDGQAAGDGWQQWYNASGFSTVDIGMLDIRSRTAFSFDITVTGASGGGPAVAFSADDGATFGAPLTFGFTPGLVGGFDVQRAGSVSYAGAAGAVYKATTLGGAYSSWYSVPSSANPVCVVIPYFRRNSTTKQTTLSDPDVIVACDNGKLYWIDGTTATATDITPTGMFDNANCVTVSYGHHIACFGKVGATYHLFTSTNGGASWTDRGSLTSPGFLRTRRNDNRASVSGTNKGQLYLASNSVIGYSSVWASGSGSIAGLWPRNMPTTGVDGFDVLY